MTTPALEARSLRLRLRWEREVAYQLAHEAGRTTTVLEDTLIAAVGVSRLTSRTTPLERQRGGQRTVEATTADVSTGH
jgi:hypothetical protein